MEHSCTIELFAQGRWQPVASVGILGDKDAGWRAKTYSGYAAEWAIQHSGAIDAFALCSHFPVTLEPLTLPHWPVFLIDMLPQGYGRRELHLGQPL